MFVRSELKRIVVFELVMVMLFVRRRRRSRGLKVSKIKMSIIMISNKSVRINISSFKISKGKGFLKEFHIIGNKKLLSIQLKKFQTLFTKKITYKHAFSTTASKLIPLRPLIMY